MRAKEFIVELQLPKNNWTDLDSAGKQDASDNLIDLVHTAYAKTELGSFINKTSDVISSDWLALDWDENPDIDSTIFYRGPRRNEQWRGNKIQGLGHDGTPASKEKVLNKVVSLLNSSGWWIEANGTLQRRLLSLGVKPVTDEEYLKRVFNTNELYFVNYHEYKRLVNSGWIIETVFGDPAL